MIDVLLMGAAALVSGGPAQAISPVYQQDAADRRCMAAAMATYRHSSGDAQANARMQVIFFYGRVRGRGLDMVPPERFWSSAYRDIGNRLAAEQARCDADYRAELGRLPPPQ